ncbi:MAG: VOC family protein [Rhodospirillaceae bacterium]|nr:VOC family protein [Rhodospirillaceae bacterium]
MFDHISIGVSDMARSRAFYDAVLATLGFKRVMTFDAFAGYGTDDGYPRFCINPPLDKTKKAAPGPGTHICFQAPDRKSVQAFHAAALANGAKDDGPPGVRENYDPKYFAAFVLDPDGHKIEAVTYRPE